jgi:hypothetical protein
MRRNLSITTAAAALLIGTVFAAAQGVQRPGGSAEPGGAQMAPQQDGGKGKGKAQPQQQPRTQSQGGDQTPGRQGQAAPEGKGKAQSKEPRTQGQGSQGQPQQQGQQPKQPKQQPQQGQQTPRDTQKPQKDAEGKADAQGGVKLTTDQRTKIRTTVLQGGNAPRVNNVNFSISVGTVVPRDRVRLVAVPPTLIEIRPAWRGYMYFVVGERIIIVEPRSYKIVAVLVV